MQIFKTKKPTNDKAMPVEIVCGNVLMKMLKYCVVLNKRGLFDNIFYLRLF